MSEMSRRGDLFESNALPRSGRASRGRLAAVNEKPEGRKTPLQEFAQFMDAAVEQLKLPTEVPTSMPAAGAPMSYAVLESHVHCLMQMTKSTPLELTRLDRAIAAMEERDGAESARGAKGKQEGGLSGGQQIKLEIFGICKRGRLDIIKTRRERAFAMERARGLLSLMDQGWAKSSR